MPDAKLEREPRSITAEREQIERVLRNTLERARIEYDAARDAYIVALKRFSALTVSGIIPDNFKR